MDPVYTTRAQVTGGRAGHGRTTDGRLDVELRQPVELGGDGEGTNPEQLFAIGYAACFSTVLTMLGQRRKLAAVDPVIDASVMLVPAGNGTLKLSVELAISLPSINDPEQAAELVLQAHQICPYSNATRGNVDVRLIINGISLAPAPALTTTDQR